MTEEYPRDIPDERPLTPEERRLARWMLEHGTPEAVAYLDQLERARVVSRCACGCATIHLEVEGMPTPCQEIQLLGDYYFSLGDDVSGAFIYHCGGVLAGIEVYAMSGETPKVLPPPESLVPLEPAG